MNDSNIGLFFGSFNPIHNGHIRIAEYVLKHFCEEVWFIISPTSPFKREEDLLDMHKRLEIVRKSISNNSRLSASDVEFNLPKPSYTINTLSYIRDKYPDTKFSIIMGEDNINGIERWKSAAEIISNYKIYYYPRSGMGEEEITYQPNFVRIDAELLDVSSTDIRNLIASKNDISKFVSPYALSLILDSYL